MRSETEVYPVAIFFSKAEDEVANDNFSHDDENSDDIKAAGGPNLKKSDGKDGGDGYELVFGDFAEILENEDEPEKVERVEIANEKIAFFGI